MKKLKLNAQSLGELLTREQLKKVTGGYDDDQIGCSLNDSCSVYFPDSGTTVSGYCTLDAVWGGWKWEIICHCSATPADTVLTSNGGVSRCGSL